MTTNNPKQEKKNIGLYIVWEAVILAVDRMNPSLDKTDIVIEKQGKQYSFTRREFLEKLGLI